MSGSESAGIWVGNRLAARVQLTPEDPVLTYTDDWKASGFALSPALPLTGPADSRAVTAFFENMLPESRAFENLVLATQISAGNKIGLALKLGYDLPGAMRLTADTSGEVREAIRPVTAAEITSRIEAPDTHPMDLWDNRPRVTVAGAQPKLNLLMTDGRYVLAEGSTIASDRILKFEPKGSPFLAINEFLSLELAAHSAILLLKPGFSAWENTVFWKVFALTEKRSCAPARNACGAGTSLTPVRPWALPLPTSTSGRSETAAMLPPSVPA